MAGDVVDAAAVAGDVLVGLVVFMVTVAILGPSIRQVQLMFLDGTDKRGLQY
ncbi:hypothetical protein ABZ208_15660 [Streptomyces sp. NPDC006208]|uniref:hypothetical protein n=1 Tax=Streptomyces sp. NPDC006208 TaxID=3156734 RepID=UPI0033AE5C6F